MRSGPLSSEAERPVYTGKVGVSESSADTIRREYESNPILCSRCGAPIKFENKHRYNKFCSRSCSVSAANLGKPSRNRLRRTLAVCLVCGGHVRELRRKYCSKECYHKVAIKEMTAERLKKKRVTRLAITRRYQARKLGQKITQEEHLAIKRFYACCPDGCEVDHKIPLSRGGKHRFDNLQYLPVADNRRKSNKLDWAHAPT